MCVDYFCLKLHNIVPAMNGIHATEVEMVFLINCQNYSNVYNEDNL